MGDFVTVERREFLKKVAARVRYWRSQYPELAQSRIANRVRSEGIRCDNVDVEEALARFPVDESSDMSEAITGVPIAYTSKEAAEIIGIEEDVFKGWFVPSYKKKYEAQEGYTPLPEGCPVAVRLNPNAKGKPALFSRESVEQIKEFLKDGIPFPLKVRK